jgi:hypothetical protein
MSIRVGRGAVALLAVLLVACTSTDEPEPAAPSSTRGTSGTEAETEPFVTVGAGPVGLAAEGDAVWVVLSADDAVARIPAGADAPDLVVPVPGTPCARSRETAPSG